MATSSRIAPHYTPRNAPVTTARVSMVMAAGMHHPAVRFLARATISAVSAAIFATTVASEARKNNSRFQWPSGSFRSENLMRAAQRKIPLVADLK